MKPDSEMICSEYGRHISNTCR